MGSIPTRRQGQPHPPLRRSEGGASSIRTRNLTADATAPGAACEEHFDNGADRCAGIGGLYAMRRLLLSLLGGLVLLAGTVLTGAVPAGAASHASRVPAATLLLGAWRDITRPSRALPRQQSRREGSMPRTSASVRSLAAELLAGAARAGCLTSVPLRPRHSVVRSCCRPVAYSLTFVNRPRRGMCNTRDVRDLSSRFVHVP